MDTSSSKHIKNSSTCPPFVDYGDKSFILASEDVVTKRNDDLKSSIERGDKEDIRGYVIIVGPDHSTAYLFSPMHPKMTVCSQDNVENLYCAAAFFTSCLAVLGASGNGLSREAIESVLDKYEGSLHRSTRLMLKERYKKGDLLVAVGSIDGFEPAMVIPHGYNKDTLFMPRDILENMLQDTRKAKKAKS